MTDRHIAYVVTLAKPTREDDAEHIIAALRMVKGVEDVKPIVQDLDHLLAVEAAKGDLRTKIQAFLVELWK